MGPFSLTQVQDRLRRLIAPRPSPVFLDRHPGTDFLVLCTGPSIRSHSEGVLDFISTRKPIIIGCNNIPDNYTPHYHFYSNRRRFQSHGSNIHKDSKVILGEGFDNYLIESVLGSRPYEQAYYYNRYPGKNGKFEVVREKKELSSESATVGPLACGIAIQMGAVNIYIAGMDGYSVNEKTHHYEEKDNKERQELLFFERTNRQILKDLQGYLSAHGGRLRIITPTAYKEHESL